MGKVERESNALPREQAVAGEPLVWRPSVTRLHAARSRAERDLLRAWSAREPRGSRPR